MADAHSVCTYYVGSEYVHSSKCLNTFGVMKFLPIHFARYLYINYAYLHAHLMRQRKMNFMQLKIQFEETFKNFIHDNIFQDDQHMWTVLFFCCGLLVVLNAYVV